jgi:hypothetical protein
LLYIAILVLANKTGQVQRLNKIGQARDAYPTINYFFFVFYLLDKSRQQ